MTASWSVGRTMTSVYTQRTSPTATNGVMLERSSWEVEERVSSLMLQWRLRATRTNLCPHRVLSDRIMVRSLEIERKRAHYNNLRQQYQITNHMCIVSLGVFCFSHTYKACFLEGHFCRAIERPWIGN